MERGREEERRQGLEVVEGAKKNDIWSWTDEVLASKYEFCKEIGFGNWGSVWQCRLKPGPSPLADDTLRLSSPEPTLNLSQPVKALKLVHRTKTPTTAARIRSLWTEFKVIRRLKEVGDGKGHRNVVKFEEFVITPSYAIIVMDYHPKLMPVCLPENVARKYFVGLLSGLEFLHANGISHNDIKPANILLSEDDEPILVDFGFAQSYDLSGEGAREKAFKSSLSWGTPEYLSPERCRGELHDEALSDIWSLGVTMYEMVVGRTPFEVNEEEEFLSKEQLDEYYDRTRRGEFLGQIQISKGLRFVLMFWEDC
ncbi:kinase-like protein [Atractiella rhizophila]|nr:kinase-like protein [Atractiella rhizophila]